VLERWLSGPRVWVAVIAPIAVFVVLNLVAQVAIRWIGGWNESLVFWQWSAVAIPLLAFLTAYVVALTAAFGQMRRLGWWRLLQSNQSLDAIRALSWRDFERLVAAAFYQHGWVPELVGQGEPDGGLDLILRQGKQLAIVQCKQRRFPQGAYVEEREVREFAGVFASRKATKGYVVTSGVFTPQAVEFAERIAGLELIAGDELLQMVGRCPKCKAALEPKHGKYGLFLSCVRYPACDGALKLAA
jgi:restriction system protein